MWSDGGDGFLLLWLSGRDAERVATNGGGLTMRGYFFWERGGGGLTGVATMGGGIHGRIMEDCYRVQ